MTDVTTMPVLGDWTVDDLDRIPDDGLRYELVDGVLLVSPSPLARHQLVLSALLVRLAQAAPPHLRVLPAPLDITFSRTRLLQRTSSSCTRISCAVAKWPASRCSP